MTKQGGTLKGVRTAILSPRHQADAALSQANPVSGTKYTVLDTTKNVRIIGVMVSCTWTVQPSPLEGHITIDGLTSIANQNNPGSDTSYFGLVHAGSAQIVSLSTTDFTNYRSFLLEGSSVKIEVEITGGTVSNLSARVKYAKW